MRAWLQQHRQALAAALRRLGWLNAVVIGAALSLPAGGYALLEDLHGVAGRLALDTQISVFLRPETKRADTEALARLMRADRRISDVRFVPRDEALKDLATVQGMPEVIEALGRNPLPDAFVVTSSPAALEALAAELGKQPQVAHVQTDAAWARRLAALAGIGRVALWLLAALLGFGLVAVTFNTIRLQILTQRDEIEVSKLIGATDVYIRRPFFYMGLLQGLLGGTVALAIVALGLWLLNREVGTLAQSYGSAFRFRFLAPGDAAAIVGFAGLLGALGAQLSVRRHLRDIEPR